MRKDQMQVIMVRIVKAINPRKIYRFDSHAKEPAN